MAFFTFSPILHSALSLHTQRIQIAETGEGKEQFHFAVTLYTKIYPNLHHRRRTNSGLILYERLATIQWRISCSRFTNTIQIKGIHQQVDLQGKYSHISGT